MKLHLILWPLGLSLLASCLSPVDPKVEHNPLEVKQVDTLQAEVPIETNPSTFTMFYWPDELDWESPLYNINANYETKLTALMTKIRVLSDRADQLDREVFERNNDPEFLKLRKKVEECSGDPEAHPNCDDLMAQYMAQEEENMELAQRNLEKKAQILQEIKTHLDRPERDGTPSVLPENWVKLGEREDSLFRMTGNRKLILLKKFGNDEQSYSSNNDREINGWKVTTNTMGLQTLHFALHEKDQRGDSVGLKHEFHLERSRFLNYVRYFGKVYLKDEAGRVIRAGMAKIDFAVK